MVGPVNKTHDDFAHDSDNRQRRADPQTAGVRLALQFQQRVPVGN